MTKKDNYDYTPEFLELRKIVNEVDPIKLIRIYCPDDEYDPEIKEILELIPIAQSLPQLALMIQTVFVKWFDEDIAQPYENYFKIAQMIWNIKDKCVAY